MLPYRPSRSLGKALLIPAMVFLAAGRLFAQTDYESAGIAAHICKFLRHVDWPTKRFLQPDAPFVIGVFGESPVLGRLQETMQSGVRIKGHPVLVRQVLASQEFPSCHVLFIPPTQNARLHSILHAERLDGVLTIGAAEHFLKEGGIINFLFVSSNLEFQIDDSHAKRQRISISPDLLDIALPPNIRITDATPSNSSAPP